MRNFEKINNLKINLATEGVIKGIEANGKIIPTEEIKTKGGWRKDGYKIKKDETPIAHTYIYVPIHFKEIRNGKVIQTIKMMPVNAGFYKETQTTKIEVSTLFATSITLPPAA